MLCFDGFPCLYRGRNRAVLQGEHGVVRWLSFHVCAVPQTQQMLWSNAIFDFLSIITSLYLLSKLTATDPMRSAPILRILNAPLRWVFEFVDHSIVKVLLVIVADLVLACFFAVLSLWVGLLGSAHQVTIQETLRVLVGLSTDGRSGDFGPFFWALHTAFIPTGIFVLAVILTWITKVLFCTYQWLCTRLRKPSKKRPYNFFAVVFACAGLFFGAIAAILGPFT